MDHFSPTQTKTRSSDGRQKFPARLINGLEQLLGAIYPDHDCAQLLNGVLEAFWPKCEPVRRRTRVSSNPLWNENDSYVITYGNSFINHENKPLDLLHDFLENNLKGVVSGVHILPYFPFTSDDGFAVTDYYKVNSTLGAWEDIGRISESFSLMSDLVINHCSSQSHMFNEYLLGHEPYDQFFFEASKDDDLSLVVRPRSHPLLREVKTASGIKHVWCTFSHDQVDFDFSNPEVLFEFLRILRFHISKGVKTLRLDAIAFLWKQVGTTSIHLHQTHAIVRLFRLLADFNEEPLILITETNVPNIENLSYFGNGNEAHVIYNFALPPLILHGLLNGTSEYLNAWQMSMPPAQVGCTYFNFTASHDGIGMRPAEGLISEDDIEAMIHVAQKFGGLVSFRELPGGKQKPYEINISYFDALKGTIKGEDDFNLERFLCSQTIAMGLEGIPGIYIHSLLGTRNDLKGVEKTKHNRAINRKRLEYSDLVLELEDANHETRIVLDAMRRLLKLRSLQPAFHPNATQFTLQLGDELFGFWRQSMDRSQSVFALHSMVDRQTSIPAMSLNLIAGETWIDILSGEEIAPVDGRVQFNPYQCRWITNKRSVE